MTYSRTLGHQSYDHLVQGVSVQLHMLAAWAVEGDAETFAALLDVVARFDAIRADLSA